MMSFPSTLRKSKLPQHEGEKGHSLTVDLARLSSFKEHIQSESESTLFAKCAQTHKTFVEVFTKLLVHTRIHTCIPEKQKRLKRLNNK